MQFISTLQTQLTYNLSKTYNTEYSNLLLHSLPNNTAFIIDTFRSPITKSKTGILSKYTPEIILSELLIHMQKRNPFIKNNLSEIIIGNALQQGSGLISSKVSEILSKINLKVQEE